jgi:uncharacterized 2Fe-2S/4Fe-4S cluster protein (DUF4445 family)
MRVVQSELGTEYVTLDLQTIRLLPQILRDSEYQVRCTFFQGASGYVLTQVDNPNASSDSLGLAVDLGTTRYVVRLVDLLTGEILGEEADDNPQITVGVDVLTRIHAADQAEGAAHLQQLIVDGLNTTIASLCAAAKCLPNQIHNIALAGNTAMTHFLLGLPTHWMIREPYIPALNTPDLFMAKELGLQVHHGARILCFPNVGSYFGGDLFAGILSSGMDRKEEISLLVDVGTNAEVVLGCKDWLIVCAGAAGPALEEGVSKIGKQARPGIIDQINVDPETLEVHVHTIGDLPPEGICGSGVIDLAAALFQSGLLDIRGKFVPERCPSRFFETDWGLSFVVVPASESGTGQDLVIGQPEIDSLIRSKAAMFTILETLLTSVGLRFQDLNAFYVAGTFGNFINPRSAIQIGMLPDLPLEYYQPLGNSSLAGATQILLDPESVSSLEKIHSRMTYMELNVNQDFMHRFSAAKFLPHTDPSRFPSVNISCGNTAGGNT